MQLAQILLIMKKSILNLKGAGSDADCRSYHCPSNYHCEINKLTGGAICVANPEVIE
jgi:hypothetical protein